MISIVYFILLTIFITILLLSLNLFLIKQDSEIEKLSPYECGFNPFEDARHKFDIRFYLVGILFIIFDLEVAYLFPWALIYHSNFFVLFLMILFILILLGVLIYEWLKGALDW
jgi:NADH-quinone oxidoreductase subunit A